MSNMFNGASTFNQDISGWSVSAVENMSNMFFEASKFDQDIGGWNVSAVENMGGMFFDATVFNRDITGWEVGSVTNMASMFEFASAFNQDISGWDVSEVVNMNSMFEGASSFDQDIRSWNVSNVLDTTDMFTNATIMDLSFSIPGGVGSGVASAADAQDKYMFFKYPVLDNISGTSTSIRDSQAWQQFHNSQGALSRDYGQVGNWDITGITDISGAFSGLANYNLPLKEWDTSDVTDMTNVFNGAANFNLYIGNWDTANVERMNGMFDGASKFDSYIGDWDVDSVQNMRNMFRGATVFSFSLPNWDVSDVTNMSGMFNGATKFDRDDVIDWNVSSVTDMSRMFEDATIFDQDISGWDVTDVTDMSRMFKNSAFDQPIGSWDVNGVTNMSEMFSGTPFNQDISGWDVSDVMNMSEMFENATKFDQDISGWDVSDVTNMDGMFSGAIEFKKNLGKWADNLGALQSSNNMFSGATKMIANPNPFSAYTQIPSTIDKEYWYSYFYTQPQVSNVTAATITDDSLNIVITLETSQPSSNPPPAPHDTLQYNYMLFQNIITPTDISWSPTNFTGNGSGSGNWIPTTTIGSQITVEASANTLYYIASYVANKAGPSGVSNLTAGDISFGLFQLQTNGPPSAPTSLVITRNSNNSSPTGAGFDGSWGLPLEDGNMPSNLSYDYRVLYSSSAGGPFTPKPNGVSTTLQNFNDSVTPGDYAMFNIFTNNTIGTSSFAQSQALKMYGLPGAPQSLSGTSGSSTTPNGHIQLTWDSPSSTGGFDSYQYVIERGGSGVIGTSADINFIDTTVTLGNTYTYNVKAQGVDADDGVLDDFSGNNAVVTNVLAFAPPDAPTVTAFATGTSGQVQLNWQAPNNNGKGILGYAIRVGESSGDYSFLGTQTTFTVPSLNNGQSYTFGVRAINEFIYGIGDWSADTTTVIPYKPPDPPTIMELVPANEEVGVVFSPPDDDGGYDPSGFLIQYKATSAPTWSDGPSVTFSSAASSYTSQVEYLTNGIEYSFRMRTFGGPDGTTPSTLSDTSNATPFTVPGLPQNLAANGMNVDGGESVNLTWSVPGTDGCKNVIGYDISYSGEIQDSVTGLTYTATGLSTGQSYTFGVRAKNAADSVSDFATVIATPITVPGKPIITSLGVGISQQVLVEWAPPNANGGSAITSYDLSYSSSSDPPPHLFNNVTSPNLVSGLTDGDEYTFAIRAVNTAGAGEWSFTQTATPGAIAVRSNGTTLYLTDPTAITGNSYNYNGTLYRIVDDNNISTYKNDNIVTSRVANMSGLFQGATNNPSNVITWDVSGVTDMSGMFANTTTFNQDLSYWDVSDVTNMDYMFYNAVAFDQSLYQWSLSSLSQNPPINFATDTSLNWTPTEKPRFRPQAPQHLSVVPADDNPSSLTVLWRVPPDTYSSLNEITGYQYEYSGTIGISQHFTTWLNVTPSEDGLHRSFTFTGPLGNLVTNDTYTVQVKAKTAAGYGPASQASCDTGTTQSNPPPPTLGATPLTSQSTGGNSYSLTLTWTAPSPAVPNVTYEYEFNTGPAGFTQWSSTFTTSNTSESSTFQGSSSSGNYARVRAKNSDGQVSSWAQSSALS